MNERLRIETSFDHEGAHARLYEGDRYVASAYEYANKYETWLECQQKAIEEVKKKSATYLRLGPAPADSTILVNRNELEAIANKIDADV